MPTTLAVTPEENLKLLVACCIFDNDKDKVAAYMGITKNAVNKRYAKLIADEKAKAVQLGMLDAGATTPKRQASTDGRKGSAKKAKVDKIAREDNKGEDEDDAEVEDGAAA